MNSTQKIIKYLAVAFAIFLTVEIFLGIYKIDNYIGGILTESEIKDFNIEEFDAEAKVLSIDINASKLIIKNGDTLKVETNNKYIETKQINEKLEIKETKHNIFKNNNSEVIVYIPEPILFDNVYISNSAGTINIENLDSKIVNISFGAGKVEIENLLVTENATIEAGAGEVKINKSQINNLNLECGIGKVTLNTILKGQNKIEAGIGELNINLLNSIKNYTIKTEKGIGSISINNEELGNNIYGDGIDYISVEGGIGSIKIYELELNNL